MSAVNGSSHPISNIEEDLLDALQCPVCFEYMTPPITLCQNGHSICQECKPRFNNCPTCRRTLLDTRNIALESLARTLQFPCRYSDEGCTEKYSLEKINAHQAVCPHRMYKCILAASRPCDWEGKLKELRSHMMTKHPTRTSVFPDDEAMCVVWEISQAGCFREYSHVIFAFGEIFKYHKKFDIAEKKLYFLVQHLGAKENAAKFQYKYKMTRNEDKFKISMTCRVHQERDNIDSLVLSGNCISVAFDTVVSFGKGKRLFHIMRKEK